MSFRLSSASPNCFCCVRCISWEYGWSSISKYVGPRWWRCDSGHRKHCSWMNCCIYFTKTRISVPELVRFLKLKGSSKTWQRKTRWRWQKSQSADTSWPPLVSTWQRLRVILEVQQWYVFSLIQVKCQRQQKWVVPCVGQKTQIRERSTLRRLSCN